MTFPSVRWRVVQAADGPLIALTADGYEALSLGIADSIRWMRDARRAICYYASGRSGADCSGGGE